MDQITLRWRGEKVPNNPRMGVSAGFPKIQTRLTVCHVPLGRMLGTERERNLKSTQTARINNKIPGCWGWSRFSPTARSWPRAQHRSATSDSPAPRAAVTQSRQRRADVTARRLVPCQGAGLRDRWAGAGRGPSPAGIAPFGCVEEAAGPQRRYRCAALAVRFTALKRLLFPLIFFFCWSNKSHYGDPETL